MQFYRITNQAPPVGSRRVPIVLIWLACGVVLATIFDRFVVSDIPVLRTVAGVLGVLLTVCWMFCRVRGFRIRRGSMIWMMLFLVIIICLDVLRYIAAGNLEFANSMQWVQAVAFAFIILDLSGDDRAAWYIFSSLFASIVILAFIALFSDFEEGIRAGSDLTNLNAQAYYFALMAIALYVFIVEAWPRLTTSIIVAGFTMVLLVLMLLATSSRGAVAAFAVGISVATWLLLRLRNKSAFLSLVPLLLVGGIFLVLSSGSAERWQRTLDGEDYGYRDVIWAAAIEMVREEPLMGHGPRFVAELGDQTRGTSTSTHNQYLMLLMGYGVFGFIIWLAIVMGVTRRCWHHRRHPMAVALLAMIACSLVYGFAADLTFKRFFWVLVALAANVEVIVGTYPTAGKLRQAFDRNQGGVADRIVDRFSSR